MRFSFHLPQILNLHFCLLNKLKDLSESTEEPDLQEAPDSPEFLNSTELLDILESPLPSESPLPPESPDPLDWPESSKSIDSLELPEHPI